MTKKYKPEEFTEGDIVRILEDKLDYWVCDSEFLSANKNGSFVDIYKGDLFRVFKYDSYGTDFLGIAKLNEEFSVSGIDVDPDLFEIL